MYDPTTPWAVWPFELMNVLKCPSCGHSISAYELERIKRKNAERISCGDEPTTRG